MHRHREIVLLLGAPGAGKGTQARFISGSLGVPHVASGDLLREHRRQGTALGRAAQAYMDRGDLVPDQLVIDMVVERLARCDAKRGALLDGFPRTRAQAEALRVSLAGRGDAVRAVLYLAVPQEALVERLAGRWTCTGCQTSYHERFQPPSVTGRCNLCGAALQQREDDRREVVEKRVEVYLRDTQPLIDYYGEQRALHALDGDQPVESVRASICAALGGVIYGWRRKRWHLFLKNHETTATKGGARLVGRTLCGKFIEAKPSRALGTAADFESEPCRDCARLLRGSAAVQHPTPMPMGRDTEEALSSSA